MERRKGERRNKEVRIKIAQSYQNMRENFSTDDICRELNITRDIVSRLEKENSNSVLCS